MEPCKKRARGEFKAAAFIGIRRSNQGLAVSFFIRDEEIELADLGVMLGGLKMVQDEFRQAFYQRLDGQNSGKRVRSRKGGKRKGSKTAGL